MNKLRGTRSTGCKGKAGKEGGSKQGQTGTDEKTKGRSRGGWGWADGAENGEERRKCGEHREHRERGEQAVEAEKTGNVYRKCTIQKKDRGIASAVFCLLFPVVRGSLRDTTLFGGLLRRGFGRSLCRNLGLGHRGGRLGLKDTLLKCLGVLRNFAIALCDAPLVHGERKPRGSAQR